MRPITTYASPAEPLTATSTKSPPMTAIPSPSNSMATQLPTSLTLTPSKSTKFWTLGTLFPVDTQDTVVESSGNLAFQRKSLILTPDTTSEGIKLAPTTSYFLKSSGWTSASDLSDANNTILWPDSYFIIRHPSSVTESTTFTSSGSVDTHNQFVIPLSTNMNGYQDNAISIPRPVGLKLSELELISSGAFTQSSGNLAISKKRYITNVR